MNFPLAVIVFFAEDPDGDPFFVIALEVSERVFAIDTQLPSEMIHKTKLEYNNFNIFIMKQAFVR